MNKNKKIISIILKILLFLSVANFFIAIFIEKLPIYMIYWVMMPIPITFFLLGKNIKKLDITVMKILYLEL